MQKIGDITPTANADGEYREGNPAAGVGPTLVKAAWLNSVQRELVNAIEGLGGVLDPGNDSQLLGVIQTLAGTISEWANIKNRPNALLALSRITSLSSSTALTAAQTGLVLIDASSALLTITLPASNSALGVSDFIIRRTDSSGNQLIVQVSGTDKIMLDTTTSSTGQVSTELLFAGDYLHLRSDGTGKWWCVGQAQLPGSIASGLVGYQVAGAFTYTVPAVLRSGRRKGYVKVVGGGGSGRNSSTFGGGGGGGGVAEGLLDLTGVQTVAVAVGAGGAGVAYDSSNGVGLSGGTSSFGGYMSATGGTGGDTSGQGGRSGNGAGGTLNYGLGDGQSGGRGATSTYGIAGSGGGPGGSGVVVSAANASLTNLRNGQGPGGGGGGRMDNGGFSGAGHDGEVTIKW